MAAAAGKPKRSRRHAQRIPSIPAHLLTNPALTASQRASIPSATSGNPSSAAASNAQSALSLSALAVSLPPLQRSQTVVTPKHSTRRVEPVPKQATEEQRDSSEQERAVANSRHGRRSESLLAGGRLAELSKRRVDDELVDAPQPVERVVSEPEPPRQAANLNTHYQHTTTEHRAKVEEEQKEESSAPTQLKPLHSSSHSVSNSIVSYINHASGAAGHASRPSLNSFASSPLSTVSDHSHTTTSQPPTASFSARLAPFGSSSSSASDSATPNKRQTRRKLRAAESSMREAAELAAEGDVDAWIEGGLWIVEKSKEQEDERRKREGDKLGRVEVAVCEDPNKPHRQSMEDAHTIFLDFNPPESPPELPTSSFVAVYDGHGGTFASTYAKRHLHRLFAKHLQLLQHQLVDSASDSDESKGVVQAAFEATFNELSDVMTRSKRFVSCGTTAVCCYIQQLPHTTVIHCANIGDAQAFLLTPPTASSQRLSTVHTATNVDECMRIEAAGGHILLHRLNGVLAVTRALGDSGMHKAGLVAVPAYRRVEVEAGSGGGWLLLCCDGVSDVLSEGELLTLVTTASQSSDRLSAASMASMVVNESLSHQSTDNITACMIRIHPS